MSKANCEHRARACSAFSVTLQLTVVLLLLSRSLFNHGPEDAPEEKYRTSYSLSWKQRDGSVPERLLPNGKPIMQDKKVLLRNACPQLIRLLFLLSSLARMQRGKLRRNSTLHARNRRRSGRQRRSKTRAICPRTRAPQRLRSRLPQAVSVPRRRFRCRRPAKR